MLITMERYISIVHSIRRKGIVTTRRVIIAITVSRVYTLLVGVFPILSDAHAVQIVHGVCLLMFPICYQTFQVIIQFWSFRPPSLFLSVHFVSVDKILSQFKDYSYAKWILNIHWFTPHPLNVQRKNCESLLICNQKITKSSKTKTDHGHLNLPIPWVPWGSELGH